MEIGPFASLTCHEAVEPRLLDVAYYRERQSARIPVEQPHTLDEGVPIALLQVSGMLHESGRGAQRIVVDRHAIVQIRLYIGHDPGETGFIVGGALAIERSI